jgi:hypothetical protein
LVPALAWRALHRLLALFAFICGSSPSLWDGEAPALAASQAAKKVEPQMNANGG